LQISAAANSPKWAWAGFFYGLGGFQLFDGIIDHKVLRLHQVRYVENLFVWAIAGPDPAPKIVGFSSNHYTCI